MDLLLALPAFAAAVGLHALAVRLPLRMDSVTRFAIVGGLVAVLLGLHVLCAGPSLAGVAALAVYAFACELYLFLFASIGTSVSARILLTLRDAPRTAAELERLYASAGMVEARFEKLRAVGLLAPAGSCLTPRGRCLARLFLVLKQFFRHAPSTPTVHPDPSRQPSAIA